MEKETDETIRAPASEGLTDDETLELKETLQTFNTQIKKRIADLEEQSKQAHICIDNRPAGFFLELHSSDLKSQQLACLALDCWNVFFNNKKDRTEEYIG